MNKFITLGLTFIITASSASFAGSIDNRQENQQKRIGKGIHSGEVTRIEAKKMVTQQKHIAKKEAQFKSDGVFTRKERANIQHRLNNASANIYRKKHNNADRR